MRITGYIKSYIFINNDNLYKIASVITENKNEVVISGYFPMLEKNLTYDFVVTENKHPKYGMQYKLEGYQKASNDTKEGIINYLSSDKFPGIGEKTATRIFDLLKENVIEKIIEDYKSILSIPNMSIPKAKSLQAKLIENKEQEQLYLELHNLDLTSLMVSKLVEQYGDLAMIKIKENPYRLIYELDGYGFKKSDSLALKLEFKYDDEKRIKEGILYALYQYSNERGFVFLTERQVIEASLYLFNNESVFLEKVTEDLIIKNINELINSNRIVKEENRLYSKYLYEAELSVANKILQMHEYSQVKDAFSTTQILEAISKVEERFETNYLDLQKEAIISSINNQLSIITGGPGTGKTTTIKGLIFTYASLFSLGLDLDKLKKDILLVAPTGRAAKRMYESTKIEACTIHKALECSYQGDFKRDENNLLECKMIVIDEASMVDINLANSLFKALPINTKVVIVGDENQLPSVGPGNFLHDLINSKVFNLIRLTKIMRQSEGSNIIKLASSINEQRLDFNIFTKKEQVYFYYCEIKDVLAYIKMFIERFIASGGNFLTELQILAPIYSSQAGIDSINQMIQANFNNSTNLICRNSVTFKENDRVLQLKNQPELQLMNGDIGIITKIVDNDEETKILINFDGNEIEYPIKNLNELTLAYAISIHKSQGSEFLNVIMPIVPAYFNMLKRNIIYTAVTRAKNKLIIIGNYDSFSSGITKIEDVRQTTLTRRLTSIIDNIDINEANNLKKIVYINDPDIPFSTLGEVNPDDLTPYSFMED